MRSLSPDRRHLIGAVLVLSSLSGGCTTSRGTYLDPETGHLVAEAPTTSELVCRYEAPSGSSIRQKVCYRQLTEQGRQENLRHAMEQLQTVGKPRGPGPQSGQRGPD